MRERQLDNKGGLLQITHFIVAQFAVAVGQGPYSYSAAALYSDASMTPCYSWVDGSAVSAAPICPNRLAAKSAHLSNLRFCYKILTHLVRGVILAASWSKLG